MKNFSFFKNTFFYKPAIVALLLGLSRLPLKTGFLCFFAFLPLFSWFDEKVNYKKIIYGGLVFSTVYTAVSLHWISLVTFPGFIGLFILFGIYFSLLFWIISRIWTTFPRLKYLTFISFWISFEYLQNFGEFRFPWFNIGYSITDYLKLIQLADIGGIYLLSVLVIIINIFIFRLRRKFILNVILLFLVFFIWNSYGANRLKKIEIEETSVNVAIVQVSIPQEKKWQQTYLDTTLSLYETYTKIAAESGSDLVIWPEGAMPIYLLKSTKHRSFVRGLAIENQVDIFTGFPHYERAPVTHKNKFLHYNSCTKLDKDGHISPVYKKNVLVPFGERIPFLKIFPFLWNVHLGQANWEYGTEQKFYKIGKYNYSPLICFEIAFPGLTTKMAQQDVDFIVNITNDAWFKRSAGTYQHAMMTKIRAVETRKQIYRAANTGYSLVVSPLGEIINETKLYEKVVINDNLLICENNSIFTKKLYWFPLVFVILSGLILLRYLLQKKKGTRMARILRIGTDKIDRINRINRGKKQKAKRGNSQ